MSCNCVTAIADRGQNIQQTRSITAWLAATHWMGHTCDMICDAGNPEAIMLDTCTCVRM
jgi:hypothetical protein